MPVQAGWRDNGPLLLFAHPACLPAPAGTLKNFVLDGQHQMLAAAKVREMLESQRKEVPAWCRQFRCTMIQPDTDKDTREVIGGRQQARQAALLQQSMGPTFKRMLTEVERVQEEAAKAQKPVQFNLSQILEKTYEKTGRAPTRDGSLVYSPPPPPTVPEPGCLFGCSVAHRGGVG